MPIELPSSTPRVFTEISKLPTPIPIERFGQVATEGLKVMLNGDFFTLPLAVVGQLGEQSKIAYFDPKKDLKLADAGAAEIAQLLQFLQIDCIVGVSSSKSEEMLKEAVKLASNKRQIVLEYTIVRRGPIKGFSGDEYLEQKPIPIDTITGDDQTGRKFVALNSSQVDLILSWIYHGKKIAIVDDVVSTGATVSGIQKAIDLSISRFDDPFPVVSVIEEVPFNPETDTVSWQPQILPYHYPAIVTPVF